MGSGDISTHWKFGKFGTEEDVVSEVCNYCQRISGGIKSVQAQRHAMQFINGRKTNTVPAPSILQSDPVLQVQHLSARQ